MLSTDDKNFPVALMGFSHQSCNLQFAPTLTLPSPRSHDNKQRKILLHFEVEVCTLFLKSYISVRTWWSRSCPIRTTWSSSSWSSSSLWLSTGCFLFWNEGISEGMLIQQCRLAFAELMWNLKKRTMENAYIIYKYKIDSCESSGATWTRWQQQIWRLSLAPILPGATIKPWWGSSRIWENSHHHYFKC